MERSRRDEFTVELLGRLKKRVERFQEPYTMILELGCFVELIDQALTKTFGVKKPKKKQQQQFDLRWKQVFADHGLSCPSQISDLYVIYGHRNKCAHHCPERATYDKKSAAIYLAMAKKAFFELVQATAGYKLHPKDHPKEFIEFALLSEKANGTHQLVSQFQ